MTQESVAKVQEMTKSGNFAITIKINGNINKCKLHNNVEGVGEYTCSSDRISIDEVIDNVYKLYKTLEIQ